SPKVASLEAQHRLVPHPCRIIRKSHFNDERVLPFDDELVLAGEGLAHASCRSVIGGRIGKLEMAKVIALPVATAGAFQPGTRKCLACAYRADQVAWRLLASREVCSEERHCSVGPSRKQQASIRIIKRCSDRGASFTYGCEVAVRVVVPRRFDHAHGRRGNNA